MVKIMKINFINNKIKTNYLKIEESQYKNQLNKLISIKKISKLNNNKNLFILNKIHQKRIRIIQMENKNHKVQKRI